MVTLHSACVQLAVFPRVQHLNVRGCLLLRGPPLGRDAGVGPFLDTLLVDVSPKAPFRDVSASDSEAGESDSDGTDVASGGDGGAASCGHGSDDDLGTAVRVLDFASPGSTRARMAASATSMSEQQADDAVAAITNANASKVQVQAPLSEEEAKATPSDDSSRQPSHRKLPGAATPHSKWDAVQRDKLRYHKSYMKSQAEIQGRPQSLAPSWDGRSPKVPGEPGPAVPAQAGGSSSPRQPAPVREHSGHSLPTWRAGVAKQTLRMVGSMKLKMRQMKNGVQGRLRTLRGAKTRVASSTTVLPQPADQAVGQVSTEGVKSRCVGCGLCTLRWNLPSPPGY